MSRLGNGAVAELTGRDRSPLAGSSFDWHNAVGG